MLEAFDNRSQDDDAGRIGEKQIKDQILEEMKTLDPDRAVTCTEQWAKGIQIFVSRPRSRPFPTLEEYLQYRRMDAGEM